METQMRQPLLSSSDMSAEQRALYKDMRNGIETNFKGFTAIDETGALIGPHFLHHRGTATYRFRTRPARV